MTDAQGSGPYGGVRPGTFLGRYQILELLGAGGMGEIYRALDPQLGREVAVKVLLRDSASDPDRLQRFEREARAVAALAHPNILSIHDVGRCEDVAFAVMELLEGKTLRAALGEGALPARCAIDYAVQIAQGLSAAHRRGIIHRDLKPDNLFVTKDGRVKILDFGLAKLKPALDEGAMSEAQTASEITSEGTILGTAGYMSPEQVRGTPTDLRSDIFSFGAVLYEMLSGSRAFKGETAADTMTAILTHEPPELRKSRKNVAPALDRIVRRCLEKSAQRRFQSAQDIAYALEELSVAGAGSRVAGGPARSAPFAAAAIVTIGVVVVFGWLWHRFSRERWALEKMAPEISRLLDTGEFAKAAALSREARAVLPNDPILERLWMRATAEASIESSPPGADVSIRPYRANDGDTSEHIGRTPLKKLRVPKDDYIWRIAAPGFAPMSFIDRVPVEVSLHLRPEKTVPSEMVVVLGGETGLSYPVAEAPVVRIDDYLIDQHEITNQDYKRFVDAGGYQDRKFWAQPFVRDGHTIPWEKAVATFRDATGRPGPATWEVGSYPAGLKAHPVAGVSWYEAAAYAEFAGKSLPTVYHWTLASQEGDLSGLIASGSNFRGPGVQAVGGPGTMSGSGTSDMAGNVKEWCWNEYRDGKRFILGGGVGEPNYMFTQTDAQSPWDRRPNYGFRCARLDAPAIAAAAAKIKDIARDFSNMKPVSDIVFDAYRGMYSYDKTPLNPREEPVDAPGNWRHQKVSFDAAYGHERMIAHLFLPQNASPPFQAVVYFPGSDDSPTFNPATIDDYRDYILKSGRVLVIPVYKGTFERQDGFKLGGQPPALVRDLVLMTSKDLGRTLDYLQTRKDIDGEKIGYLGFSRGGWIGPVLLAVEKRLKVAILSAGGLQLRYDLPEVDGFNFAPRVTIPVLMLNGRYEDIFPVASSQLPLFRLLGTPARDKRHVIYETGHGSLPRGEEIRESLDWLDKYLGPVRH